MRISSALKGLFLAVFLIASRSAHADVVPPAGDCEGKAAGTACKDESGNSGACGTLTHSRTFMPPFPDAAPITSQTSYFACKSGETPTGQSSSALTSSSSASPKSSMCSISRVGSDSNEEAFAILFGLVALGATTRARKSNLKAK